MLSEESKDKQVCYVVLAGELCSCIVYRCSFHVLFAFSFSCDVLGFLLHSYFRCYNPTN